MVPVCSSGTLINVLPHRNAMPQTQDMTPQPVTVYRHGADLSLCYLLMWNNCLLAHAITHASASVSASAPAPNLRLAKNV